jgi:hypothetical protein
MVAFNPCFSQSTSSSGDGADSNIGFLYQLSLSSIQTPSTLKIWTRQWAYLKSRPVPSGEGEIVSSKSNPTFIFRVYRSTSAMMMQEIQSSDEKAWSDLERNTKVISDDDALLSSTGKIGELKRYYPEPRFSRSQLTLSGCTISGLVSLLHTWN